MQNKKFIILITVASVLIISAFSFIFYVSMKKGGLDQVGPTIREFIPLGSKKPAAQNETPALGENKMPETATITPIQVITGKTAQKITQISQMPIAGSVAVIKDRIKENGAEQALAVRYVDKITGNIYETFVDEIKEKRISSTTIPKIEEAMFFNGGDSVILRYLKNDNMTIESFLSHIAKEIIGGDASTELKGSFLSQNITDLSVSSDAKNLFYLFESGDGVTGINLSAGDENRTQIFQSAFSEWLTSWQNPRLITLNTKASARYNGFLYGLDPQTKSFSKILGGIPGLTTLMSPSGKIVLYSGNDLRLKIFDTAQKTSIDLGLQTLPEKCTWSLNSENIYCAVPQFIQTGDYPDDWYQGVESFNDSLWRIDIKNNTSNLIADPSSLTGQNIDGIKMFLSPKEDYLFFTNKKDSTLWTIKL